MLQNRFTVGSSLSGYCYKPNLTRSTRPLLWLIWTRVIPEALRLFLDAEANLESRCTALKARDDRTPLWLATDELLWVLDGSEDLTTGGGREQRLYYAEVALGCLKTIEILLSGGADPNALSGSRTILYEFNKGRFRYRKDSELGKSAIRMLKQAGGKSRRN